MTRLRLFCVDRLSRQAIADINSRQGLTAFDAIDPFRKPSTRICCDAQRKSYGVCRPQQRIERIAIKRVAAAWKCSVENMPCGPYGGEAQVVSSAGRPLSKFIGTAPK